MTSVGLCIILYDHNFKTDCPIAANEPDIVIRDWEKKIMSTVEVAVHAIKTCNKGGRKNVLNTRVWNSVQFSSAECGAS